MRLLLRFAFAVAAAHIALLSAGRAAPVQPASAARPVDAAGISPLDNYEQWKSALDTGRGVVAPEFTLAPGFQIETVRTAGPDEGSWIALAFDRQGRLVIAREKRGLLRFTPGDKPVPPELIDDRMCVTW